jgi:hypothetical protein
MLEDGVLHIQLSKSKVGESWPCACKGHGQLNAVEMEKVKQDLLLQRFQREHAGFDFSGAKFSGAAPDATAFLGGVDHNKLK